MITDARVLQPEFIPREVKHRDAEVNYLSSVLRPILDGRTADPSFPPARPELGRPASPNTSWNNYAKTSSISTTSMSTAGKTIAASKPSTGCLTVLIGPWISTGIPDRLTDRPELARAFGFDPDNLPSDSTFRPCRLEDRFSELEYVR